jgi:hypothetical protein
MAVFIGCFVDGLLGLRGAANQASLTTSGGAGTLE